MTGMTPPRVGDQTAEVMVTVKTYPNPSETYSETVCVAGVRLDRARPEWIRLYPVKFRNEDFDKQFKKYEILRVNGTYQQPNDNRPESFRPRQDELQHVEWLDTSDNWQRRRMNLGDLIGETTMCDLLEQNPVDGMGTPSPSLGLIKPIDIEATVVDGAPWTAAEQAKVEKASAPDLFGTSLKPLEPAPFAQDPRAAKVVVDGSSGYRDSRLWLAALLRKTPVPYGDQALAGSTHMLAIALAYQQPAVTKALDPKRIRARILIADAVGLGKTIEIG